VSGDSSGPAIPAWRESEVRAALGLAPADGDRRFSTISTDSRNLPAGALFVALSGERFDGHTYLPAVAAAGAAAAIVREGTPPVSGLALLAVPDPLRAFGRLARARRRAFTGPVIAITGTNGKTSTKEMLAAALGTRYVTYATRANLNNLVGVPLTILEAPVATEALVVEAGANLPGEIARYREIIEPDLVVVTNAVAGHLEGFGSLAGVLEEKLSLTEGVARAIVGTEPPALAEGARRRAKHVRTAALRGADLVPDRVELGTDARPRLTFGGVTFTLGARGMHQAGAGLGRGRSIEPGPCNGRTGAGAVHPSRRKGRAAAVGPAHDPERLLQREPAVLPLRHRHCRRAPRRSPAGVRGRNHA
jgi:UDP-N-acetylmuramoyl-tripeptide--D-alanyl-D-alanine ligase